MCNHWINVLFNDFDSMLLSSLLQLSPFLLIFRFEKHFKILWNMQAMRTLILICYCYIMHLVKQVSISGNISGFTILIVYLQNLNNWYWTFVLKIRENVDNFNWISLFYFSNAFSTYFLKCSTFVWEYWFWIFDITEVVDLDL